jgi:general secretion pathway protein G
MKTIQRSQGFSLIELLVVLMILGLIASVVVPNLIGQGEKANASAAKTQIQRLAMAIDEFYLDAGRPPQNLRELVERPGNASSWNGPYVNNALMNDPWGNPYNYRFPGQHRTYDIFSYGSDGSPGGEGAAADINNWEF